MLVDKELMKSSGETDISMVLVGRYGNNQEYQGTLQL